MNLIENSWLSMVRAPLQAVLLTVALVMADAAHAGESKSTATVDVWPQGRMPGRATLDPEMEKPSKDAFHRITNVSKPTLTLFPAPGKNVPAVIVCPGGGYGYVVIDKEGSEIATWLNSIGVSALVLKYRVPNQRADALMDLQRAISLTRARAAEWNIDPKRLGVIGFSAGGHLSARASNQFNQRSYPAMDDVDEQSCRPDFAVLVYPAYLDDRKGGLSPDLDLKADIPPTLIVHSEDDSKFIVGSKLYSAALEEAKHSHRFLIYQTGGHGYGLHCEREAKAWPAAAAEWLQQTGMR
jgi:acetyl esterase/lipase